MNLNVSSPPHHSCLLRPAHEETAAGKDCLEVLELHIQYHCTAIYCGYQLRYGIALSINSCAHVCQFLCKEFQCARALHLSLHKIPSCNEICTYYALPMNLICSVIHHEASAPSLASAAFQRKSSPQNPPPPPPTCR